MKRRAALTALASLLALPGLPEFKRRPGFKVHIVKVRSMRGRAQDVPVPVFDNIEEATAMLSEKEVLAHINRGIRIKAADRARSAMAGLHIPDSHGDPAFEQFLRKMRDGDIAPADLEELMMLI